ncbi:MAG: hypothetical protein WCA35_05565 [Kovacikia sp.]
MTTRSLDQTGLLSKLSGFLQTPFPGTSKPLRDNPANLENPSSTKQTETKQTEAFRELRKTYFLERRCFF